MFAILAHSPGEHRRTWNRLPLDDRATELRLVPRAVDTHEIDVGKKGARPGISGKPSNDTRPGGTMMGVPGERGPRSPNVNKGHVVRFSNANQFGMYPSPSGSTENVTAPLT